MSKLFAGQALLVDLVVGIPLVLAMAVMVYASVYWSFKLLIIFLLPRFVYQVEESIEPEDELDELQKQHGAQYWQQDEQSEKDSTSAEGSLPDKKSDSENSTKSF
ncbi:hypothetical protein [Thiomicrorhabdus sediminis]|nr:hypothetical protein [Thiomicrorhabdus sediminis]